MKKLKQFLFDAYCILDHPFTQAILCVAIIIAVILLINGKI